jgi:DNA helicase II / ATP-dependent DNA helicase PcrA
VGSGSVNIAKDELRRVRLARKINKHLSPSRFDSDIFRLNLQQLDYVNFDLFKSSYLKACPGSGKTEVVGVKSAYAIKRWKDPFSGIAVLSFTRNAAKEIKTRVLKYAGPNAERYPHFIGTFDSWLHSVIFQPFAANEMGYKGKNGDRKIRIIDNEIKADFLSRLCTNVYSEKKVRKVWPNEYFFLPDDEIESISDKKFNIFDKGIIDGLKQKKREFFKWGLATYQDAAYLSFKLLKKDMHLAPLIAKRFPIIIIDECQDLCYNQLTLLYYLWEGGSNIHLIGDANQSIYEFRKVSPEKLNAFLDKIKPERKELKTNYRSNQCIVDACCRFIGEKNGIGNEALRISTPLILWQFEKKNLNSLPEKFRQKLESFSNPEISYAKSAVLVRGRGLLGQISRQKRATGEYVDDFLQALFRWNLPKKTTCDIDFALMTLGRILCRLAFNGKGWHQNQDCPDCLEPLEWRYFLDNFIEATTELHSTIVKDSTITLKQCTGLIKKFISKQWHMIPHPENIFDDINLKIRTPKKRGDEPANLGYCFADDQIRITTIHDVKGETLEAVLLISSPDGRGKKGGFYQDWFEPSPGDEEFKRFAYVAFSRPKHLLIVATPQLEERYLKKFRDLGFVEEKIPE